MLWHYVLTALIRSVRKNSYWKNIALIFDKPDLKLSVFVLDENVKIKRLQKFAIFGSKSTEIEIQPEV